MRDYYPLLVVGGVVGFFALCFLIAYAMMKDKKEAIGFDRHMKDSELMKRLIVYAKPYFSNFLLVLFFMVVSIIYDIASPRIIGQAEEMMKTEFDLKKLLSYVILYAVLLCLSMACLYFQRTLIQKTGQKIITGIRKDTFSHIESLSHEQLNHIPVGKLVTRVTNDTEAISVMFTNIIVNLFRNVFVIIGVLIAMLTLNVKLTLLVLCFTPFIFFFTFIFRKFSRRAYRKVKDGTTDINTFLSENLMGMKITQIFNREDYKMQQFTRKNDTLADAKKKEIFVFSIFRPVVYMLYISSVLCLLYIGGKGYIDGTSFMGQVITSGIIVAFYMYIEKLFGPIQELAEQFNRLQSAFASAEKIFTILDTVPEIQDEEGAIELENAQGRIEFQNVWFAYEDEEWILKDVSFTVEAGQTVAFVGSTGSGKTTILSLICRNYDIQRGRILIDGIDIKKIKISSLRKQFGQMLQDVFLFSGTIRSNIVLREEGFTDEEIMEVCRYVNAAGFIEKTGHGLDEEVRENGSNFSAGQRQLLSFARTIIHKPAIMILDEATANIDTETEVLIQDSLEKMMNTGTMLMVAHRLSTIQHADKIIVLSHGKIIEEGSHFELLEKKGRYHELYMLQYNKDRLKNKK